MTSEEYNICVKEYADRVFRFVLKNIRSEADAHDIVQQSFEKLWRKHAGVDYAKAKSYLFTTAHHCLVDWVRDRPPHGDGWNHAVMPAADEQQHRNFELKDQLDYALAQLPSIQREAVLLRDYEGYSYKEIADITQLTDAQVKVYIFRARKKLHQILRPQHHPIKQMP